MNHKLATLALAALLGGTTPLGWAQSPGPGAGPGPRGDAMHAHWQEHMAQRAAELKGKLQLRPEQEADWARFLEAMKPAQRPLRPDPRELAQLSTPERLDRLRALRQQRESEMERRDAATRTFYATLSPEQQKVFDEQTARMWGPRPRR